MSIEQKSEQLAHVHETIAYVEDALDQGKVYFPIPVDYYTYWQPIDEDFVEGMHHIEKTLKEETNHGREVTHGS